MLMPTVPDELNDLLSYRLQLAGLTEVVKNVYHRWQIWQTFVIFMKNYNYWCIGITGNPILIRCF